MSKRKKHKVRQPTNAATPGQDEARRDRQPAADLPRVMREPDYADHLVHWSFEFFDAHEWGGCRSDAFFDILGSLRDVERLTWRAIETQQGQHHASPVARLSKAAQERLTRIKLNDVDELFRFRLSGKRRLWGIRRRNVFRVLWWDPDHVVYPTGKKNT